MKFDFIDLQFVIKTIWKRFLVFFKQAAKRFLKQNVSFRMRYLSIWRRNHHNRYCKTSVMADARAQALDVEIIHFFFRKGD